MTWFGILDNYLDSDKYPDTSEPIQEPTNFVRLGNDATSSKKCPIYVSSNGTGKIFHCYITGGIDDVDNYVDLIDALYTATANDIFHIFLDSPGGMIASGGIISSAIHHTEAEVFTIARGLCASAAALIHSSAKIGHAKVSEHAILMYHMSSHMDAATSTKIAERAANQVRYVNECLLNKALEEGHITEEEFKKIQYGEEFFIPAKEFLERIGAKQQDGV